MYNSRSPYNTGNFNISTILIKTAFKTSNENESEIFDRFRKNRYAIATRLAEEYYGGGGYPVDLEGYPVGFGKNSQGCCCLLLFLLIQVLKHRQLIRVCLEIFHFLTGQLSILVLMKIDWFKDNFKRFSLQHGYRSSYSVNAFRSNLNPNPIDSNGNFYPDVITSNVNLTEQFNPLVMIDFEMKNSFNFKVGVKKDRTMNMSFDNNLLTEVQGHDYTIGLGYRIKDVTINSKLADNATGLIKSDVNLKADFTLRRNMTIVRYLDYDNNQLGGGQNIWSVG